MFVSGTAHATYPASTYRLSIGKVVLGRATVWSEGMHTASGDQHWMELRMQIHNASGEAMAVDLDRTFLDLRTRERRVPVVAPPERSGGSVRILPDSDGGIALSYRLPSSVNLNDVEAFEFTWAVRTELGSCSRSTPFVRSEYYAHGPGAFEGRPVNGPDVTNSWLGEPWSDDAALPPSRGGP